MDGTLKPVDSETVSGRTLEAARALRTAGIDFGPASGRPRHDLVRFFQGDESCVMTGVICGGKHDVIRRLVTVALFDYLSPAANRPVSMRERASVAGIAQTTYRRLGHDAVVDSIIEQMSDRYAYARACIHNQLVSQ